MAISYAREQHLAELAVLRASILTKQAQANITGIRKDDASPVTVADFAAQALLISALHTSFPSDAFLGEEGSAALRADAALRNKVYQMVVSATDVTDPEACGKALPKPTSVDEMLDLIDFGGYGKGGDHGRFWVMDPIDGTATYLKGQQYAVSLSLIVDGREVVGVLGCPNINPKATRISETNLDRNGQGVMLSAVRGQGTKIQTMTLGGLKDPLRLNMLSQPSSNQLRIVDCTTCEVSRHDVVAKLAKQFQAAFPGMEIWSSHIRYAALIIGCADVRFWIPASEASRMHIWDHAGAQLIYTELGGKVTDLDGRNIDFGAGRDLNRNRGLVVTRGDIHKIVLAAMNKIMAEDEGSD